MASTETTPRYRNFSNNMPVSTIITPRVPSSLITVEKEPERDPEEDCFMCRQAHVYVKPIGMQQERRVARRHPPPLTRAQMDELSRKKQLTKQEAKKLLQCYFPEIKDVKYFQLHKYHSCCYDPKHLNLCKNHITALQHERTQHPGHHNHKNRDGNNENHYTDYEREGEQPNRVSFVRIKIEPTKGIPTRFLGPTALPESLADMLIKQVNRLEDKTTKSSFHPTQTSQPYQLRKANNPYDDDNDDEEDEDDDDEDEDENDRPTIIIPQSNTYDEYSRQGKAKRQSRSTDSDIVVEDLNELNRLYINPEGPTRSNDDHETSSKPLKKKVRKKDTKKKTTHGHQKPKLNHWELMALEQAKQEPCNCRHHVMRLEADQVVYDWCRCKDHQHKDIIESRKSAGFSPALPPIEPKQPTPPPPTLPPTPPPAPPRLAPKPKPRKVRKRSIGIDATQPNTTEVALAYDPSAVDYDMIQEVIYYRTSSGRLIKPEMTNAFAYDTLPPAITTMNLNPNGSVPNKAEVLYMTPNGQLQPYEGGGQRRGKINDYSSSAKQPILTYPGSLYNGQARVTVENSTSNDRSSATMPVLKLPSSVRSSRRYSGNNKNNGYEPTEFTLARFSPDKSVNTPASLRSPASGSQHSVVPNSAARARTVPVSIRKSSKPTYTNLEPTPDYGRQSSIVANRRWFDQPLGDQNLRPVHDGQYGLIAGTSTSQYPAKARLLDNNYTEAHSPKNGSNCIIS